MELRKYWEIIQQNRLFLISLVVVAVLITLLIAYGYQILIGRVYRMPVQVQITKTDIGGQLVTDAPQGLGQLNGDNWSRNFLAMARNEQVCERVIQRLKLKDSKGNKLSPTKFMNPGMLQLISQHKGVQLKSSPETDILDINGLSLDPHEARMIAATFTEELSVEASNIYRQKAQKTYEFYQQEIPVLKTELKTAEDALMAYKLREQVSDINTYRTQLISNRLTLETEMQSTDRSLLEYTKHRQALLAQLKKQPELNASSQTYSQNPQIQSIRAELLNNERSLAKLKLVFTDNYPDVISLKAQIESLHKQLQSEVEKVFGSETRSRNAYYDTIIQGLGELEIQHPTLIVRKEVLKQQIADVLSKLDDLSVKEAQFQKLTLRVESLRTRMSDAFNNEQLSREISKMDIDNLSVLSAIEVPQNLSELKGYTYFPQKKKMVMVAFFLALAAGLFIVFIKEYFKGTSTDNTDFRA